MAVIQKNAESLIGWRSAVAHVLFTWQIVQ